MIELLPDMPRGVIGLRVSGRLGGDELREFKPAIKELLETGEIRIVEVIAADYEGFGPGGLFEDLTLGFGLCSGRIIRRLSESRWCPTRNGWPIRCMRWRGWSPVSSRCSASTISSALRSGPPARRG